MNSGSSPPGATFSALGFFDLDRVSGRCPDISLTEDFSGGPADFVGEVADFLRTKEVPVRGREGKYELGNEAVTKCAALTCTARYERIENI